ncbi:hypothetical protein L6452_37384 [Arctium lappa]|uniref:Uncharacterized protein n=1 Tax=Arctium lappa TaxID=4217 RepID=A0ACB8Y4D2_ARCLA|nr:hypothetical protein L6452_37384 [Arctium lappa]
MVLVIDSVTHIAYGLLQRGCMAWAHCANIRANALIDTVVSTILMTEIRLLGCLEKIDMLLGKNIKFVEEERELANGCLLHGCSLFMVLTLYLILEAFISLYTVSIVVMFHFQDPQEYVVREEEAGNGIYFVWEDEATSNLIRVA